MNDLYNKKYQYEKLIRTLNTNYNKLQNCYSDLKKCRDKIDETLKIDDNCYSKNEIDNIINKIEYDKNIIVNNLLPQARYQYNIILSEISKL